MGTEDGSGTPTLDGIGGVYWGEELPRDVVGGLGTGEAAEPYVRREERADPWASATPRLVLPLVRYLGGGGRAYTLYLAREGYGVETSGLVDVGCLEAWQRAVGHEAPLSQFPSCRDQDVRMGERIRPWKKGRDGKWTKLPEQPRHSWSSVESPTSRFREVLLRRRHIGQQRLIVGVSERITNFPASLLSRAQHYYAACSGCRLLMETEVAQFMWPRLTKALAGVTGTLEVWTRAESGGALLRYWLVGRSPEELRGGGRRWLERRSVDEWDTRRRRRWYSRLPWVDLWRERVVALRDNPPLGGPKRGKVGKAEGKWGEWPSCRKQVADRSVGIGGVGPDSASIGGSGEEELMTI